MRILVIGSGGREHAMAWAIARSEPQATLFIAPGNPGTAALGTNVSLAPTDVQGLCDFAQQQRIDLTVVGPEQPLVMGIVDRFQAAGLAIVGPTEAAAALEGSKAFAKAFMVRHRIPTAAYRAFGKKEYEEAKAYLDEVGAPIVVKASGLAGGKGAVVCATRAEADAALKEMFEAQSAATDEVVIEAFMEGEEASLFALCDGKNYRLLATAQDHKRIGEGDTGPNTGGMGAYAPAPAMTPALIEAACEQIVTPTLRGMAAEGTPYQGILYVGLMLTAEGPNVVEYNCRLGDPEAQVVLPLLQENVVDVFKAMATGTLDALPPLKPPTGFAACVVLASSGYPKTYPTGFPIRGLEANTGRLVFHAGTKLTHNEVVTSGGRVLAVTGRGETLAEALNTAYRDVETIHFEGRYYRTDIGAKGLRRLAAQP